MKKKGTIDFKQPLNPCDSRVKWIVYFGPQTVRDGQPIKDDFKHLLLVGNRQAPVYVNAFGQSLEADGTLKQILQQPGQTTEDKGTPAAGGKFEGMLNDLLSDLAAEHAANAEARENIEKVVKMMHTFAGSMVTPIAELKTEIRAMRELVDHRYRDLAKQLTELAVKLDRKGGNG